jgi:putative oxidoreductase
LIIRVVVGLLLVGHGLQKLAGWFGGHGLVGTGGFFETLGFAPGRRFAGMAGLSEAVGGLLIALGLLTPLGAAMAAGTMLVATLTVHLRNGPWASDGGFELPLVNAAVVLGLAFTGAGAWSLDHAFGVPWTHGWRPGIVALALAVFTGMLVNAARGRGRAATDAYPAEQPAGAPVTDPTSDPADVRR